MSSYIKENSQSDEQVEFCINQADVSEALKTFVKGMNESEMQRFLNIYRKYEDKGSVADIKTQK